MTHEFIRKNDKLAIVGSHRLTRDGAPYDDPTWDICVFNEAAQNEWVKRWTWTFNIHQDKNLQNTNGIGSANHWEWLQQDHGPDKVIWTQRQMDEIPNSVAYPLEAIAAWDVSDPGKQGKPYSTSTPAHAIALGLYLGYKVIHTWGVDLSSNTEYMYQANAWRYWCGVAKGMLGENFQIINGGKQLFHAKLYGYDDDTRVGPDFYKGRVQYHDAYWAKAKKRCGALKDKLMDVLSGANGAEPKDFMAVFKEAIDAYAVYGKTSGGMSEASRFAERADILHRQEFEWHAAKSQEEAKKLDHQLYKSIGHLEYAFNVWAQTQRFDARQQVVNFVDTCTQLAYNLGYMNGKTAENIFYISEFDQRLSDASGGVLSDEVLAAQNTEVKE